MHRVFIVGAGGFGREVYSWLRQTPDWENAAHFAGFLDDNAQALVGHDISAKVVGRVDSFTPRTGDQIICAIGQPRVRLGICQTLRARGASFPVLKHPAAIVGENCRVGEGSVLCPGAILTTNVTLGAYVIVNVHATIGHDAVVGEGSTLSGHVDITGFARVGKGVFLGSHAAILPGAKVGDFACVGAGTVVLRSVKPGATVMGVPAKQISP